MDKYHPAFVRWVTMATLLLLSVIGLSACGTATSVPGSISTSGMVSVSATSPGASLAVKASVGSMAPDFSLTGVDGKPVRLSDLRGKAVVLNYWAIYWDFCRQELPDFIKAAKANQGKLTVVGINMNDDPSEVKNFIKEKGISYPVVIDNTGDMTYKYRVLGHPTSIFINQAGVITGIIPGLASPEILDVQLAKAMS